MTRYQAVSDERRQDRRQEADLGAVVLNSDGTRSLVSVSDMSYGGCQFISEAALRTADRIRLLVRSMGEIDAEIRWSAGGLTGVKFLQDSGSANLRQRGDGSVTAAQSYDYGTGRVFGRKATQQPA